MCNKRKLIEILEKKGNKEFLKEIKMDTLESVVIDLQKISTKLTIDLSLSTIDTICEKIKEVKKLLGGV